MIINQKSHDLLSLNVSSSVIIDKITERFNCFTSTDCSTVFLDATIFDGNDEELKVINEILGLSPDDNLLSGAGYVEFWL